MENLERDEIPVEASPRTFGLMCAAVFALVALWPLMHGAGVRGWGLAISAAFLAAALASPARLAPASRAWQRIGLALHAIFNPIVTGALFYLVITPYGLLMRLLQRNPRALLRPDPAAASYWVARDSRRSRMDQQF